MLRWAAEAVKKLGLKTLYVLTLSQLLKQADKGKKIEDSQGRKEEND